MSFFHTIQDSTSLIGNNGGQHCIGRTSDGAMWCVARVTGLTPDTRLFKSINDGVTWSIDGELNSTFNAGERHLIIDPSDRITIGCSQRNGGNGAHYVHRTGAGAFSSLYQATGSAVQLQHAFFARDSEGRGHVVVVPQSASEIRYSRQNTSGEDGGSPWSGISDELVVSGAAVSSSTRPVIVIDKNDLVHIIYLDASAGRYKHTRRESGSWTTPLEILPSPAAHLCDYISPCLDKGGLNIHLCFYAGASPSNVTPWYVTYDRGSGVWTPENIDSGYGSGNTNVTSCAATAQDLSGRIYAYFARDQDTAYFGRGLDGVWAKEVIDFGPGDCTGSYSSACQPYPIVNSQPAYPSVGGHFAGRFNNGSGAQVLHFAYLAGSDLSFDLGGVIVKGFGYKGAQATSQLITQLMMAYDVIAQDIDGVLTFKFRSAATDVTIADEDLGAYQPGGEINDPVQEEDLPDDSLPREVVVKFADVDRAYQVSAQTARLSAYSVDSPMQLEFPLSFNADEGKSIAERVLWTQHANRSMIKVALPPSYLTLREYDRIAFTAFGEARKCIVSKVDRGDNLLLELEALNEVIAVLTQSGTSEGSQGYRDGQINPPSATQLEILDFAPLTSDDETRLVLYFAVAASNPDALWTGGTIFVSTDDITYSAMMAIPQEASIGSTLSLLAGFSNTGVWDRINSVDVEIIQGTLSSTTEAEVLSGLNRIVVGEECIGFRDATLIATGQYRLSTLVRGTRNTERWNNRHSIGERVIHLNAGGIQSRVTDVSRVGTVLYFKAVPNGGVVTQYPSRKITVRGGSMLPWPACNVKGTRDGSNNLTITWMRRSRSLARIFGPAAAPLQDVPEAYELDIYNGATVVRTISVSTPTASYSAAQQTADGLTPGNPVTLTIYQISPVLGRGRTFTYVV